MPVAGVAPLAERMRPRTLEEYVGQRHILGPGKLLRRAIEADRLTSLILYGPPGTGKTTLAKVIAGYTDSPFQELSGISAGVADLRRVLATALERTRSGQRPTILFVDELHRFNKPQQDIMLPDLEKGTIRLIGATTHNPFFYVNSPLVSRSQIFQLEPLSTDDLESMIRSALSDSQRGLGGSPIEVTPGAIHHFALVSDGDARRCLNALELAALTTPADPSGRILIDLPVAEESIQKKAVVYDGDGDAHYDTASAFIKSLRASDPDASIYWLAKMLHAGEDPRFIARRLIIAASEDIGLADSRALEVAVAANQALEVVGLPEAELNLAHATLYLATAPKSPSSTRALGLAKKAIAEARTIAVPKAYRDSHYRGARDLGHGEGYLNPHDFPPGEVPIPQLPAPLQFYQPTTNGMELRISERLETFARLRNKAD